MTAAIPLPFTRTSFVLREVLDERERQEAKWGEQNHPDGTGPGGSLDTSDGLDLADAVTETNGLSSWARERCKAMFDNGDGTYEAILTEEWAEALDAEGPDLRTELIQVAAVAVAWIEAIDRRTTVT